MLFAELPTDILAPIAEVLIGNDIIKLIMTGNVLLRTKMRHVVRSLALELPLFSRYPMELSEWPSVTSLCFKTISNHDFYPFILPSNQLIPAVPQNRLLKLRLECAQSFDLLDTPAAKTLLPNLPAVLPSRAQAFWIDSVYPRLQPNIFEHFPGCLTLESGYVALKW